MKFYINSQKIIEIGTDLPDSDLYLFGWEYSIKYIFGMFPYIIYTKQIVIK